MCVEPSQDRSARAFGRGGAARSAGEAQTPLLRFLARCHAAHAGDRSGHVADYIPELSKADPAHFGVSIATIDGHVYGVGDSTVPFTVQSISKPFVFALALETLGAERVEGVIGVEPSGDVFNSVRLRSDNRPFNPMVNAGAITCSALLHEALGANAFAFIRDTLGRYAGGELAIDEAVFESERLTGDRNRAIAFLLRNHGVVRGDVDAILDVYFRQCSILVTARDLAVMGACLANKGVNPVTGTRVASPYAVARTLSIMTTAGMYDFAGEWIYRVGIPAKSGVSGGILGALPSQLGVGTYSPLVDEHGNSLRGIKVCEELSASFSLHALNRTADVRTSIIADYNHAQVGSRRARDPQEQRILDARPEAIRVIELAGALSFASVDFLSRRLTEADAAVEILVLDFRRVPSISEAGGTLLKEIVADLGAGRTTVVLSSIERATLEPPTLREAIGALARACGFPTLDGAMEWAEDQIVYRYGGFAHIDRSTELAGQELLVALDAEQVAALAALATRRMYRIGERIVAAGEPGTSVFFLQRGMVSIKLEGGVRLATMVPGMAFGEMALLGQARTADVWADTPVVCLELPLDKFKAYRRAFPASAERIARNLAKLLAKRLRQANAKIAALSGS